MNLTWKLYPIVSTPKLAREMLFSPDISADKLAAYFPHLQNEAYLAYLDMLAFALPRPKRVKAPMLVLAGTRDRIFTVREARRTAKAYHTEAKVFPDTAHDMMLEANWQSVADAILAWLADRNL